MLRRFPPFRRSGEATCGGLLGARPATRGRRLCASEVNEKGDRSDTKQDLHDIVNEFREKKPHSRIPDTAFPDPHQLTERENKIIDEMLALLNKHGLNSNEATMLLERLGGIKVGL